MKVAKITIEAPVVSFRSQDLARIVAVEELELEEAKRAYLENTLLPFNLRKYTGKGITVLMPRYISPPPEFYLTTRIFLTLICNTRNRTLGWIPLCLMC